MDIAELARQLTALLAPALPGLQSIGDRANGTAGPPPERDSGELAGKVWPLLWPKLHARAAAVDAITDLAAAPNNPDFQAAFRVQLKKLLSDVAATPDDPDAQAALRLQIRKLLTANEHLAVALAQVLETAAQSGNYHAQVHGAGAVAQGPGAVVAGQGGVAVGGDVHEGVRVGGTDFIGTEIRRKS